MVKLVDTGDLKFVAPIKHIVIFCNRINELQLLCKIFENRFPAIFPQNLYKTRRRSKVISLIYWAAVTIFAAVVKLVDTRDLSKFEHPE